MISATVAVAFLVLAVIAGIITLAVLLTRKSSSNAPSGPFCPFPDDPDFNAKGCSKAQDADTCRASVNTGFTADTGKCRFSDPKKCQGGFRPNGCGCIFNGQCLSGKCSFGTCVIKL